MVGMLLIIFLKWLRLKFNLLSFNPLVQVTCSALLVDRLPLWYYTRGLDTLPKV